MCLAAKNNCSDSSDNNRNDRNDNYVDNDGNKNEEASMNNVGNCTINFGDLNANDSNDDSNNNDNNAW